MSLRSSKCDRNLNEKKTDATTQIAPLHHFNVDARMSMVTVSYRCVFLLLCSIFIINVVLIYCVINSYKSALSPTNVIHDDSGRLDSNHLPFELPVSKSPDYPCTITHPDAIKALQRVRTETCRQILVGAICSLVDANSRPMTSSDRLRSSQCPFNKVELFGRYEGCFEDSPSSRLLTGHSFVFNDTNSPEQCAYSCLRIGSQYSGIEYQKECFCSASRSPQLQRNSSRRLEDRRCKQYPCPGDKTQSCGGFNAIAVYNTGYAENKTAFVAVSEIEARALNSGEQRPRMVFLLQVNGRNVRQVRRLLKTLYRPRHFYYVHVDSRTDYLYQEMLRLESLLFSVGNFRVKRVRYAPIWGGSSLLTMILDALKDILSYTDWKWQFVTNLSESDFPISSVEELESIVMKYAGKSFLKSHGGDGQTFITKQGLDRVFVECERRMWRIGDRPPFPRGVVVDGGSDWVGLDRRFVEYLLDEQQDRPLKESLWQIFSKALLPAESYFHTLAKNSRFCGALVDLNLRHTNWRRKQGCKCQYKHIVDWCGCSPNVITAGADWPGRLATPSNRHRGFVFARKFDPAVDQRVIALAEAQANAAVSGHRLAVVHDPSFDAVWINEYDQREQIGGGRATFLNLFIGRMWRTDAEDADEWRRCLRRRCQIGTASQLNVYRMNDRRPFSIVAMYDVHCGAAGNNTLEVLVERQRRWVVPPAPTALTVEQFALVDLDVGTDFDVKEAIFRNYAGIIARDSLPSARLQWRHRRSNVTVAPPAVRVVWLDPGGQTEASNGERLTDPVAHHTSHDNDEGAVLVHQSVLVPTRHTGLQPGIWTCRVVESASGRTLAELTFPVFPLPSEADAVEGDLPLFTDIASYFQLRDVCLTLSLPAGGDDGCAASLNQKICREIRWSSLYPDPKSDINLGFDETTSTLR